jgi:hypothetical protein
MAPRPTLMTRGGAKEKSPGPRKDGGRPGLQKLRKCCDRSFAYPSEPETGSQIREEREGWRTCKASGLPPRNHPSQTPLRASRRDDLSYNLLCGETSGEI